MVQRGCTVEMIIGKLREAEVIIAQGGSVGDACKQINVTALSLIHI